MTQDKKKNKKVFVMMSGGVDSSVAALLLKNQGYDVVGVFMRCFNLDGCAERDAEDARRVAEKLKIPFYSWDFEKEYKNKVVEYMIDGYKNGLTPNPDIMCNKEIKFGLFLDKALKMGADYVATGHYVKIKKSIRRLADKNQNNNSGYKTIYKLLQAKDKNKDQSYFLWTLTQKQLKHCLFPIGDYLKPEVREIARKAGLPTAEKKDSQGICFLGKITLADFLAEYMPQKKGPILLAPRNTTGSIKHEKIGEHKGAYFYTIGQRHLNIAKRKAQSANNKPLYVAEKNIKTNALIVTEGSDNPALYKKEICLQNVNFINPQLMVDNLRQIFVKVRYRQPLIPANFIIHNSKFIIQFNSPVKFVAPGQSAVFYGKNGEMLGGGIIV
ncbi:MAG: tRNA 2-thiouridine(34) synthase MnmA [Patescibacteria group bacterium]|mgnify:CR=1 FL=1